MTLAKCVAHASDMRNTHITRVTQRGTSSRMLGTDTPFTVLKHVDLSTELLLTSLTQNKHILFATGTPQVYLSGLSSPVTSYSGVKSARRSNVIRHRSVFPAPPREVHL